MCTKQFQTTSFTIHNTGFRHLLQHCCHPPRHILGSLISDQIFLQHLRTPGIVKGNNPLSLVWFK